MYVFGFTCLDYIFVQHTTQHSIQHTTQHSIRYIISAWRLPWYGISEINKKWLELLGIHVLRHLGEIVECVPVAKYDIWSIACIVLHTYFHPRIHQCNMRYSRTNIIPDWWVWGDQRQHKLCLIFLPTKPPRSLPGRQDRLVHRPGQWGKNKKNPPSAPISLLFGHIWPSPVFSRPTNAGGHSY